MGITQCHTTPILTVIICLIIQSLTMPILTIIICLIHLTIRNHITQSLITLIHIVICMGLIIPNPTIMITIWSTLDLIMFMLVTVIILFLIIQVLYPPLLPYHPFKLLNLI